MVGNRKLSKCARLLRAEHRRTSRITDQQVAFQPSGNRSRGQVPALSFATSGMPLMVLRPLALSVGVEERQAACARPRPWERCSESSVLKCVDSNDGIKCSPRAGSAEIEIDRKTSGSDHAHNDQNTDLDQ